MMNYFYFLIAIILALGLSSCNDDSVPPKPLVDENNNGFESFAVAEIFAKNCATSGCHEGNNPPHGLDLSSHSKMLKGSKNRPIHDGHGKISHENSPYGNEAVIPFSAENSILYNLITGNVVDQSYKMPLGKPSLSQSEIETIKNWINNGAKDNKGNIPYSNPDNYAYVTSQGGDKVHVIDMNYNVVARILDVNFNPTGIDAPHNVMMDENYYYVTLIATGEFLKIHKSSNTVAGKVSGIQKAGMIVLSPDGNTAYISRSSSADPIFNSIYAVDITSMTKKAEIILPVTGVPHAIAISGDGKSLYVANMSKDRIDVINTATLEVMDEKSILLSQGPALVHEPMHIYLSPDDQYLYVNNRTSSKMLVYRLSDKHLSAELQIKDHPMQAAIKNDGSKIYVVSHHEEAITEITKSGESWTVTNVYEHEAFHHLYGADLDPSERYLYVSCANNDPAHAFVPHYEIPGKPTPSLLCVYDVQEKKLIKMLDIGSYATGVAARKN